MHRLLTRLVPVRSLSRQLLAPLQRFLEIEAASGVLLIAAAALAVAWANSPWWASYSHLWHAPLAQLAPRAPRVPPIPRAGAWLQQHDLLFCVNDGLMTLFFLVVGLELHRELEEGTLARLRVATLPVAAALGGVAMPALVYVLISPQARGGWAVPTATDIAFALAVLTLLGRRIPQALRVLLLTLAIADDIAGILIIALFYSSGIRLVGLAIAAAGALAIWLLQRLRVHRLAAQALPALAIWYGMLEAGAHPALAGVILGLMTPVSRRDRQGITSSPCIRLETALHPWVAYLIMPLFALANAGVSLRSLSLSGPVPWQVLLGVMGGLVLGKPLGIMLATLLAVRLRLSVLPDGIRPAHILLLGCLGGVGFTISIFIANLAFSDDTLLQASKLAVLCASALAALIALTMGSLIRDPR